MAGFRESLVLPLALALASCGASAAGDDGTRPFQTTEMGKFEEPWALAFLPGGASALVTEKAGTLKLWRKGAGTVTVSGAPKVAYGGQGGLGDVALAPDFAASGTVYLSWAEPGPNGTAGAALGRARLVQGPSPRLDGLTVIWRQDRKVTGEGHFSHRIAFSPDGKFLFVSSGERQKFTPAQDLGTNLGKVVRLLPDGTPAPGNPFAAKGGVSAQIWSYGHRNVLGLKFDAAGRLWDLEHGPRGGDELNLVKPGLNYGWPLVSDGDHYDGRAIPRNRTRPDLAQPAITWNPVIAPGDFIFYRGAMFPRWQGHALIAGLASGALVDVAIEGDKAREVTRHDFGQRLREIVEHPDGSVWILEDGPGGRLLRLTPRTQPTNQ
ncbi:PQQ-dependent sugar dehydrogenase [Novosphingobium flavum]|uniref:PQQ-dependent sugar dehydrogenase n=1 Tax=Novosphingobium flavum TaxID=1778672 RepID=A0A7X1FQB5_9SPHN|nr:PQQ-dependent sugar dehydrogenase [Novosphingobium flavum]MBC2665015.1 PQQ-dependent sugar dehydrogenase [Novosphingobium flavum]